MINKQTLQKAIDYGLLSILFIFPFSLKIELISPQDIGHPLITINFSLADLFILVILLLWLIKLTAYKEWKQVKLPPDSFLIFIGIGILSLVDGSSIILWLKELIKFLEYFVIFYILLCNNLKNVRISVLKKSLFVFFSILLVLALIQQVLLNADVYLVRGLFDNHNIFAVFICILIPIVYFDMLSTKKYLYRIWMILLLLVSLFVLTSGSTILSLLISLSLATLIYNPKKLVWFSGSCIAIFLIYTLIVPKKNVDSIKESVSIFEQGSIRKNYYQRLVLLQGNGANVLFQKKIDKNLLQITSDNIFYNKLPAPHYGDRYKEMEGKKHIKNHYLEMQAAINLMSENTLLGVGLGNYQNSIGTYFIELPKVNTAEPNQNNTYLIIGSTLGILGLASLLWLFFSAIKLQFMRIKSSTESRIKLNYLGIFSSLIALFVEGFFSMLFIASLMVPIVIIFYLSNLTIENIDNKLNH